MNEMKICTKCKEEKELGQFGKSNRTKNGLQNHCKKCLSVQATENKLKRAPNIKPDEGYKTCSKCNVKKHVDEFYLNPNLFMGVHSECITCTKNKVNSWNKDNPEKVKARPSRKHKPKEKAEKKILTEKTCTFCLVVKPLEQFAKDSCKCRSCVKEYTQNRRCSIIVNEKQCGSCKKIKPASDYNKDINTVSGLCSRCGECRKIEYEKRKHSMMASNKIRHNDKYKND